MPDRICADGGGENVLICEEILRLRGLQGGSFITHRNSILVLKECGGVVIQFHMDLLVVNKMVSVVHII